MSISSDLQAEVSPVDTCLEEVGLAQAIIDDATVAEEKLQADAPRLFSPSGDNFDITLLREGSQGSGTSMILPLTELQELTFITRS